MQCTYLLVSSIIEIVLVISTSAAVVLPVGLNSNCSYKLAGVIAGMILSLTIRRSTIRDRIGVTDIGRRSLTPLRGVHLGTGVIAGVHHAVGTTP